MGIKAGPKWKKVWIHLSLVFFVSVSILLLFFYAYLPWYTNHGEVIVVPDFHGMSETEVIEVTDRLSLRYEVLDSAYSEKDDPSTVISQNPKPNFEVKNNRRVYITLNTSAPPRIEFTKEVLNKIISRDKTSAKIMLESLGMKVGTPTYVSHRYKDLVLNLIINDQKVKPGNTFYKGAAAKLVIGSGN